MSARKSLRGQPTSAAAADTGLGKLSPGRILDAVGVAELLSLENPTSKATRRWVSEHVPGKKAIGHRTVRWLERDVVAWVESKGNAA